MEKEPQGILGTNSKIWNLFVGPPPAAARYCVEQLRIARLKRQASMHIVAIPRLFTNIWRKQLHKIADLVMEIPPGAVKEWSKDQFEPLTIAIVFPFIKYRPWQLRGCARILELGRELRKMWKKSGRNTGDLLLQFCNQQGSLDSLSKGMVWKLLQSKNGSKLPHSGTL